MIKNITGNWVRKSSPRIEAGKRVCRIESLLSEKGYRIDENSPVSVRTDRVVMPDEMLLDRNEKSIYDGIVKRVGPTDSSHAGNLHMLIWNMLHLGHQERKVYLGECFNYECVPGEIEVHYKMAEPFNWVYLGVKTEQSYKHLPKGDSLVFRDSELFDYGSTKDLIVELKTHNEELAQEILKVAHAKVR